MLLIVKMVDSSVNILKVINITVNVTSTHVNVFSHLMNSLNLKTAIRVMFVGQTTIRLLKNLKMICGRSVVESIRAKTKNTHIFWLIEYFPRLRL